MNDSSGLPRRVLHVLNHAAGGATLSTLGLMRAFRELGVESSAVCNISGTPEEQELLREATDGRLLFTYLHITCRKFRAPLWKRPLTELRQLARTGCKQGAIRQVTEFAQRQNVDLIHTSTILTREGGFAARRLGLPHVWHLRELIGPGQTFRMPREGRPFGDFLQAHCSTVLANSHITARLIEDWLPAGLLKIVPNGIELDRFEQRSRQRYATPHSGPVVVAMVGNLTSQWKKHGLFVEAAARVDRSLPVEFRIYGHDPSQGGQNQSDPYSLQIHQQIQRHGLADRFHLPGFASDPVQCMSEFDVLLHPADGESFGRIIVEGMAARLPVIGVRGGGVGEIVVHEQTGLLAETDDAAGLAAHIQRLVRDEQLRRKMGEAGFQRARDVYSIEACVAGVGQVYREALARPVGRNSPAGAQAAPQHGPDVSHQSETQNV